MKYFFVIFILYLLQSLNAQQSAIQEYKDKFLAFYYPLSWEVLVKNWEGEKSEADSLNNKLSMTKAILCHEIVLLPKKTQDNKKTNTISQKDLDKIKSLNYKGTSVLISVKELSKSNLNVLERKRAIQRGIATVTSSFYEELKKELIARGVLSNKKSVQRIKIRRNRQSHPHRKASIGITKDGSVKGSVPEEPDFKDPGQVNKYQEELKKYQEQEEEQRKKMSPDDLKFLNEKLEVINKLKEILKIEKYNPITFSGSEGWFLEFTLQLPQEKIVYRHVYLNLFKNSMITITVFFVDEEPKEAIRKVLDTLRIH